ncbi:MAG: hypothetical protein ABIR48_04760 [Gammaproteobacteria bacterium]
MLLTFMALSAYAAPYNDGVDARGRHDGAETHRQHDERRLDRAAGQVRRETGGRVLSADVDGDNGERIRIKVLTPNGRVRTVTVDEDGGEPR